MCRPPVQQPLAPSRRTLEPPLLQQMLVPARLQPPAHGSFRPAKPCTSSQIKANKHSYPAACNAQCCKV